MASSYPQASMTSTAGLIIASTAGRKKLVLTNIGPNVVFIGATNSVVTTADNANGGYPIEVNEDFYLDDYTGDVYGICAATETATIMVSNEDIT